MAGTLNIPANVNLSLSRLIVDGPGDVVVAGNIFGVGGEIPLTCPATFTFDPAGSLQNWTVLMGTAAWRNAEWQQPAFGRKCRRLPWRRLGPLGPDQFACVPRDGRDAHVPVGGR